LPIEPAIESGRRSWFLRKEEGPRRKPEERWSSKPKGPKEKVGRAAGKSEGVFFSFLQDPSKDLEPQLYIDAEEMHGVVCSKRPNGQNYRGQ
jgi:hypothetical protein